MRTDYNLKVTRKVKGVKAATSLKDTNTTPEVRYVKGPKGSDEYKDWYNLPPDKVGAAVQQVIERIDLNNYEERNRYMRYARLYGNYEALGWSALSAANRTDSTNNKPTLNVGLLFVESVRLAALSALHPSAS